MSKINCLLSIDGGASNTKAGLINLTDGKIVFEYKVNYPLNFLTFRAQDVPVGLKKICEDVLSKYDLSFLVIGVAGMDTIEEKVLIESNISRYLDKRVEKKGYLHVLNDIELVLYNGQVSSNAVAIIAGTGSNCIGINKDGKKAKAGGLDYILTDEGSGYWIGYMALKAAVMSSDGRGPKTDLESRLINYFGLKRISELKQVVYSPDFEKRDFAKLTLPVLKSFLDKGDEVAATILKDSAKNLFFHVNAVVQNLGLEEFKVIESGSVFKIKLLRQEFEGLVKATYSQVTFIQPATPSYYGGYYYIKDMIS